MLPVPVGRYLRRGGSQVWISRRFGQSTQSIREVQQESFLSLETFREQFFCKQPVILKGEFSALPAGKIWATNEFEHLRKYGQCMVPVEITHKDSTYASCRGQSSFEQTEIPLNMFLDLLVKSQRNETNAEKSNDFGIYLAQHALFDSIPDLYDDVCLPSFRAPRGTTRKVPVYATAGKADLYNINVWIGQSTHTPLHHDPYHNIFAQLYKRKKVIIFPPEARSGLSFHTDYLMKNTSAIKDVFDAEQYSTIPQDVRELGQYAILEHGDGLYIPQGWLHSFRGDDGISSSVNWWFR